MGMGTPGREAASLHPPNGSRGRLEWVNAAPIPESGSVCFLVRPGGRFLVPALRSGTGVARRGGQGRAQARPTGLVLDGPEHGASLGRSRDAEGSRPPARRRRAHADPETRRRLRPDIRGPGPCAPAKPPRARRHARPAPGQAARTPYRPSNAVTVAPSNSVNRLTSARLKADEAVKLFKAGRTVTQIANALGIGRGSVYRALETCGIKQAASAASADRGI